MNKIIRMTLFLLISFLAIGIFFAIILYLLSLLINSELNIFLKLVIMIVAFFLSTKVLYPAFLIGPFINAVPKNLMYPKAYLPFAILFTLGMVAYFFFSYSYLFKQDNSFFSLQSLLIGLFVMTAYRLLSPMIRFYFNTINRRRNLTNVEIRYGIYEDQESLVETNQIYNPKSSEIHDYWAMEFEKANLDYYEQ